MADSPDGPKENMAPLFDLVLRHVEPPKVGAGGFRMLGTLLEANPYLGRIVTGRIFAGSIKSNAPVKVLDRLGNLVETGPRLEDSRLPRHRARADRRGASRRHRRHRRPAEVQRRRHPVQPRGSRAADGAADRPADAVDDLPRQRQPARGHRGRQGHQPRHPRPPVQGGRGQCRAEGRGGAELGRLCRLRPRRIAARDPDRDDAPRGLRARRLAARRCSIRATRTARCWSRSRRS